jgi:single-strand DNA-binding protein
MSLSKIVVSGKVVRAPEKRFTPNNNMAVTEFAISVDSPARQDGSVESSVLKIVTWGELAERTAQDVKKGDVVAVDGRLQMASYTTNDGQRRRDAEINAIAVENLTAVVAGGGQAPESNGQTERPVARVAQGAAKPAGKPDDLDAIFASEDEIPF